VVGSTEASSAEVGSAVADSLVQGLASVIRIVTADTGGFRRPITALMLSAIVKRRKATLP
jgi:hypothetical protein